MQFTLPSPDSKSSSSESSVGGEPEEPLTQNGFAGADILNMMRRVEVPREQNVINNRNNINNINANTDDSNATHHPVAFVSVTPGHQLPPSPEQDVATPNTPPMLLCDIMTPVIMPPEKVNRNSGGRNNNNNNNNNRNVSRGGRGRGNGGNKNYKFKGNCNNCGKQGHAEATCWMLPSNASKRPAWFKPR
jgi:hypothetical protein